MNDIAQPDSGRRRDTLGLTVRQVSLTTGETTYIDEGHGPVVVLLHGAPFTSLGLFNLIHGLRGHCRVLAPDLPGFGGSTAGRQFENTLSAYSDFVVEFCRTLDLKDFTIFVNDSSGPIGLSAAVKLAPNVTGLVIADTVPIPLTGSATIVRFILKYVVGSGAIRWVNRHTNLFPWLVANVAPLHRRLPKRLRRAMVADFNSHSQRDRIIDLFRAMATETDFIEQTAVLVEERLSKVPALILYGQFDPVRYVGGPKRYGEVFSKSEIVIISLEEHFPLLGSGNRVAAAMHSWLSRNSAVDAVPSSSE